MPIDSIALKKKEFIATEKLLTVLAGKKNGLKKILILKMQKQ